MRHCGRFRRPCRRADLRPECHPHLNINPMYRTPTIHRYTYIHFICDGEPNLTYATPIRTRAERGRTGQGRGAIGLLIYYTPSCAKTPTRSSAGVGGEELCAVAAGQRSFVHRPECHRHSFPIYIYIYIYITIGGAEPNLTYATPIRTRAERGRTGRGRGSTSYILVYTALRR